MASLTLEGDTLGERHKYYNHSLKNTLAANKGSRPGDINHDDADIDNFLKIDVACYNRDVDYIFQVLKCKDLLYITRTIKRSPWLITDDKYADVINPKYLHTKLFPYMMTKAKNKLILQIRLLLKDEIRVKGFYKYYKEISLTFALKWLPRCPLNYAHSEVSKHANDIPSSLLKRLCKRDPYFLKAILPLVPYNTKECHLQATMFLIKNNSKEYMDVIDSAGCIPKFNKKALDTVMKVCPDRIFDNILLYANKIDYPTFFKYIKKESIKCFLLKCAEKNKELQRHIDKEMLREFLQRMDRNFTPEVLQAFFNKTFDSNSVNPNRYNLLLSSIEDDAPFNDLKVYGWYQYMPFDVSFQELIKLIRMELKSEERHLMLSVLAACAYENLEDTRTLLQYYHRNHINEAFMFKLKFIKNFLLCAEACKFNTDMWTTLNDLFCSMELYMSSSLNEGVQSCIQTIILYKVLNDEEVPEIIETKLEFDSFKIYQVNLTEEEKNKLFKYLYNFITKKVENQSICTVIDFNVALKYVEETLKLLVDWNKNIINYPNILNKIRDLAEINKLNKWNINLSALYNIYKPWKKYMFEESIYLDPSAAVLINLLKHNVDILIRYKNNIEAETSNNNFSLKMFLNKLRVYWANSLGKVWTNVNLTRLKEIGPHKNAIRSLAILLSQKEFLDIVKQNIPDEKKINWKDISEIEYSLRKNVAMSIHMVRPLPGLEVTSWFAKGDYLKYAVTSLTATLSNVCYVDREEYIPNLLDVPTSLQKHGIRMAFAKLNIEKLMPILEILFIKNSNVRNLIFANTHKLLCKEKRHSKVVKLWKFFSILIDNLSTNENVFIYKTMSSLKHVPIIIRADYCIKGYSYLKTLPDKVAHEYILHMIRDHSIEMVKLLDGAFIENVILGSTDDFSLMSQEFLFLFVFYVLNNDDKQSLFDKYDRLIKPLMSNSANYDSSNFQSFSKEICRQAERIIFTENKVVPIPIFKGLLNHMEEKLELPDDYVTLTAWKLKYAFIEVLEVYRSEIDVPTDYFTFVAPRFGAVCLKLLQEDVRTYFSSIYMLFEHSLGNVFSSFDISNVRQLEIFKHMLTDKYFAESYILVHKMLPLHIFFNDAAKLAKFEVIEILCSHPPKEFQMHCFHNYPDIIKQDTTMTDSSWRSICVMM